MPAAYGLTRVKNGTMSITTSPIRSASDKAKACVVPRRVR
jgi:carbohydrate-binding DOMON domain-containing protein